jgi:AraC family transcriptional regulator
LDESKVVKQKTGHYQFNGLELPLRTFAGARAARVIHPARQHIPSHTHDWACVTLPVVGHGKEEYDGGQSRIEGPFGIIHPPRAAHADTISEYGLETVSIQFDPRWLAGSGLSIGLDRTLSCISGRSRAAARRLAAIWTSKATAEGALRNELAQFVYLAANDEADRIPSWLAHVVQSLHSENETTAQLARRLNLHPAWLARAYRAATGEGLGDAIRRTKVQRAVSMIRTSRAPLAQIAATAGFCDQSHMNRCFAAVIGRTPLQVRSETGSLTSFCRNDE